MNFRQVLGSKVPVNTQAIREKKTSKRTPLLAKADGKAALQIVQRYTK